MALEWMMDMKIAFPILEDKGLASPINGHFGGTDKFLLVDTETGAFETLANPSGGHVNGACTPLAAFTGITLNGVCVAGIGTGAIQRFAAAGITVYRAIAATVGPNLDALKAGTLPTFGSESACAGHSGGCGSH